MNEEGLFLLKQPFFILCVYNPKRAGTTKRKIPKNHNKAENYQYLTACKSFCCKKLFNMK